MIRSRRALRLLMGALGLVIAVTGSTLVGGSAPAGAHATLQGTDPLADALVQAVPGTIELRFDEPVTASTGAVQVIAPDGSRVDQGVSVVDGGTTVRVALTGALAGTYTVAYRVVSDDGHTIAGSYVFHVRTRTGAAEVDQSIPVVTSLAGGVGRWFGYAGSIVAVGAATLLLLTWSKGGPGDALAPLSVLVAGGAVAAGLGADLAVLAQTATTTGRSLVGAMGLVPELAADSRPVAVALTRAALLLGAGLVALLGRRRPAVLVAAGAVVGLAGLLAPVAGHPWTAEARAVAVTADAVHLLAASVWIGLVATLAVTASRLPDPEAIVRRVSGISLVGALVVLGTGAVSSWQLLGSLEALLETASGQLVLLKVVGFGGLVFLGWVNRARLIPLFGGTASSSDVLGRIVQVVRAEVVVAALVLAVTAGLVNQPPGRDQIDQPIVQTLTVDEVTMRLEVEPGRAGANEMHIYTYDSSGRAESFDAAEASASLGDLPARRLALEQITPDHAVIYGASLPQPGTWSIAVTTVRVSTPREYRFEVPIR